MNRRELLHATGAALAGATVLPYLPGPAPFLMLPMPDLLPITVEGVLEDGSTVQLNYWAPREILAENTRQLDRLRAALEGWALAP